MVPLEFRLQPDYRPTQHETISHQGKTQYVYDFLHADESRYKLEGLFWNKTEILPLIPLNTVAIIQYAESQSTFTDFIRRPIHELTRYATLSQDASKFLQSVMEYVDDLNITFTTHGLHRGKVDRATLKRTIQLPANSPHIANAAMHGFANGVNDLFATHDISLPYLITPSLKPEPEFYPTPFFL